MTNPDELLRLAERVEQGSGEDRELYQQLANADRHAFAGRYGILTSLDAVEALRERLLPGSAAFDISDYATYWTASVGFHGRRDGYSEAPTEARARLAALLRAVAGKEA